MKAVLFALLLGLISSGCSTLKKPFFYEIKRDNQISSVLGTIHVGVTASELPDYVHDSSNRSTTLISEMDQTVVLELRNQKKLAESMYDRFLERKEKNLRLSSNLKPDTWRRAEALIRAQFPEARKQDIDFIPPGVALAVLKSSSSRENNSPDITRSDAFRIRYSRLDVDLYESAEKSGKNLLRIDDPNQLHRCMDEMYLEEIENFLTSEGKPPSFGVVDALQVYRQGDENEMFRAMGLKEGQVNTGSDRCLIDERNRLWAELIDRLDLKKGPYFIAVGVGHLVGAQSLFNLLGQKGFEVRRVVSEP